MNHLTQYAPLRFITAGSVDDGKSTLIGRLLYDSKALLSDQLLSLNKSKNNGETIDFSILTDGLEAEREQGITIDVAYRYFSTAKRKFIIADTPGHEQYTRNMVTGASTANAAIVLIDATQLDFSQKDVELLPQTKRHSAILKHLRCPHVIVAVNKMDLLDFEQAKFEAITKAYNKLAEQLGLADVLFVPVSALQGDNIVHKSDRTPWYQGETLLTILENLPTDDQQLESVADFHFPVQFVLRLDQDKADDFRGYQGRIEAGEIRVGDHIRIEPNGLESTVTEIYSPNGKVKQAKVGEQVTICLADDIDISRGDTFVAKNSTTSSTKQLSATICWFDQKALNPARKYLLKQGTRTVFAKVSEVEEILDLKTLLNHSDAEQVKMNDIARIRINLQSPVITTSYAKNKAAGAFILIDEATYHTVAGGMILENL